MKNAGAGKSKGGKKEKITLRIEQNILKTHLFELYIGAGRREMIGRHNNYL